MRSAFFTLCVLAALPSFAGQYDEPYGIVETGRRSDVLKELPVSINAVDGVNTLRTRYSQPISPGRHQVQVIFASDRLTTSKAYRYLDLDIQPCTRYRIVAAYQSRVNLSSWEPKIYVEPIGECHAKFATTLTK